MEKKIIHHYKARITPYNEKGKAQPSFVDNFPHFAGLKNGVVHDKVLRGYFKMTRSKAYPKYVISNLEVLKYNIGS